jgi:hypothetical protein
LRIRYTDEQLISDVRIDFQGLLSGFASDVVAMAEGAEPDAKGATYATAGVPVYVIADPYKGKWHLHTLPKDDEYRSVLSLGFGDPIDFTGTVVGLTLETGDFPRD